MSADAEPTLPKIATTAFPSNGQVRTRVTDRHGHEVVEVVHNGRVSCLFFEACLKGERPRCSTSRLQRVGGACCDVLSTSNHAREGYRIRLSTTSVAAYKYVVVGATIPKKRDGTACPISVVRK